jgi:hypothetical protein
MRALGDAEGRGFAARLEHPGRGDFLHELPDAIVIEDVHEARDRQTREGSSRAHGELVAEVARGRLAHTGHADVLAHARHELDVVVVERSDAIDLSRASEIAQRVENGLVILEVRQGEDFVDELATPRLAELLLDREKDDGAAFLLTGLDERIALEVAGDAQDRDRLWQCHGGMGKDTTGAVKASQLHQPRESSLSPKSAGVKILYCSALLAGSRTGCISERE